ncbi:hypothetical protein L1987_71584 [Smallanthus sonchifolius]|uniref:Uncharacterized protein n=1 Tax=Smallanthus sonchifolius TaxID=185202 RepID=A0ACB9ASF8_9ASTR|nr:hypothetical protein L1987_71584 [Smallanthus sonchifolius]
MVATRAQSRVATGPTKEETEKRKRKGNMPAVEEDEADKSPTIFPGIDSTKKSLKLQRRKKVKERRKSICPNQQLENKIRKESVRVQRTYWKNELVASGKFQMKDLAGIKISTVSEMVKHVRIEQIASHQNTSLNLNKPQAPLQKRF